MARKDRINDDGSASGASGRAGEFERVFGSDSNPSRENADHTDGDVGSAIDPESIAAAAEPAAHSRNKRRAPRSAPAGKSGKSRSERTSAREARTKKNLGKAIHNGSVFLSQKLFGSNVLAIESQECDDVAEAFRDVAAEFPATKKILSPRASAILNLAIVVLAIVGGKLLALWLPDIFSAMEAEAMASEAETIIDGSAPRVQ